MNTIRKLSIAFIIVQSLWACSAQKSNTGAEVINADANVPLTFANDWELSVVAGNPGGPGSRDGSATDARFFFITGIARNGDKIYLCDWGNLAIREYDLTTNLVTTLAGHLGTLESRSKDGVGAEAYFRSPHSIVVVGKYLYVSDDGTPARLRSVNLSSAEVRTINDPATGQPWNATGDTSFYLAGNSSQVFIAGTTAIFAYDPERGTIERVIGSPGDSKFVDGDVDTARFGNLGAMSFGSNNSLFVGDANDLRSVDLTELQVKTLAGSDHLTSDAGTIQGYPGVADGTGENVQFEAILGVSWGNSKTYLVDTPESPIYMEKGPLAYAHGFGRLRAYDTLSDTVDTVAGYLPRPTTMEGELDGPSETARLLWPYAVYADGDGLYVGAYASLRRMSFSTGEVDLVAGTLVTSPLFRPGALSLIDGALYTFSRTQLEVMSIDPANGVLSTVVGFHQDKFRATNCSPIVGVGKTLYCASTYIDPKTANTTRRLYTVDLNSSDVTPIMSLYGIPIVDMVSDGNGITALGIGNDQQFHLWYVDASQGNSVHDNGIVDIESSTAGNYARLALVNGVAYMADGTRVVRFDPSTKQTRLIAGSDVEVGCADGTAPQARFTQLSGIAEGPGGLFLADGMCHTVSFLSFDTGRVTQLAGSTDNVTFTVGQGRGAGINWPSRLVYDWSSQSLYIADSMDNVVGRLRPPKR
jgi:hypothetical protein